MVSLPKAWVRRNGMKKGASMVVEELSPRKLILRPVEGGEGQLREVVIDYPGEDVGQVANDLTGAYLLGYDVIKVEGSRMISRADRSSLKAALSRLVGLEIMDEDSKRMILQFLLEPAALVPEKIVKRMSGLLDGMLRDTAEALSKGDSKLLAVVGERDDEVDRLYFLLVRATRDAIARPDVAERWGLSPVDLVDYRVLASFLESTGDAVSELSRKLSRRIGSKQAAREYAGCVAKLGEMNDLATKGFITRRAGRPRAINSQVNAMAQGVTEKLANIAKVPSADGAGTAETFAALERVSKLLVDVSDLAVITRQVS